MSGFDNETVYANNLDLRGVSPISGQFTTNGQLLIGSTTGGALSGPTGLVGSLTSTGATLSITTGSGTLNIEAVGSIATTYALDSGTIAIPFLHALNIISLVNDGISVLGDGGNTITVTSADDLAAIEALGGTGVPSRTAADTWAQNSITQDALILGNSGSTLQNLSLTNGQLPIGSTGATPVAAGITAPAAGITVAIGAGSITLALADDLSAVEGLSSAGVVSRTAANTWTTTSVTDNAFFVGNTGEVPQMIGPLTDGQLLIGDSSDPPATASLTAPAAGVTITGGAGTITFALADDLSAVEGLASAGVVSRTAANTWTTTSVTDNAFVIGDASEVVQMVGPLTNGQLLIGSTSSTPVAATLTEGSNITITEGAGTITIAASGGGGGITWNEETGTSVSMAVNNGYITNNASLVTATIPTTAAVGDVVRVVGKGAGGWRIAQNASEIIHFGTATTTTGTGGRLDSTEVNDCVELVCIVANTEWAVISLIGNVTFT